MGESPLKMTSCECTAINIYEMLTEIMPISYDEIIQAKRISVEFYLDINKANIIIVPKDETLIMEPNSPDSNFGC